MRLFAAFCFFYASLLLAQSAPKAHIRFFNDSAKAVNFYVDGEFTCTVRANPEENEAYCETFEATVGKHAVNVEGPRLPRQSCDVYVSGDGAYIILSKGERMHCSSYVRAE
jgi:hypothetical protein